MAEKKMTLEIERKEKATGHGKIASSKPVTLLTFLISAVILLLTLPFTSAISQEYPATITVTPSTGVGMSVSLIEPDGSVFRNDSTLQFKFVPSYDKTLEALCNITVDGNVIQTFDIIEGAEQITTNPIILEEGAHLWSASCADLSGNSATSVTKSFVVDLTAPEIKLNNPDVDLSLVNAINLSYTATDSLSSTMMCNLFVNEDMRAANIVSANNSAKMLTIGGLTNGSYSWHVSCTDNIGNMKTSLPKEFFIDTEREFTITTDKQTYAIGESGIYIITAPLNGTVTLVITTTDNTTLIRNYPGPYPVIGELPVLEHPGTMYLNGFLNYKGAIRPYNATVKVDDSLNIIMNVDKSRAAPGETITFTGSAYGGIGERTYTWALGDGATANGLTFTHSYSAKGNYPVTLTVKDGKGNLKTEGTNILIEDRINVNFIVVDSITNTPLANAKVYLNGKSAETDANGVAVQSVFSDSYDLLVSKADYYSYTEKISITEPKDTVIRLDLMLNTTNATPPTDWNTTENSGSGGQAQPQANEPPKNENNNDNLDGDIAGSTSNANTPEGKRIETLLAKLEEASAQDEPADPSEFGIYEALNIKQKIDKAMVTLRRLSRDLNLLEENSQGLSDMKRESEKANIIKELDALEKSTIISVNIGPSEEFVNYASNQEIQTAAEEMLKSTKVKLSKSLEKEYAKSMLKIQAKATISTIARPALLQLLSGSEQEIVIVDHVVKETDTNATDLELYVQIPKELASDLKEVQIVDEYTPLRVDGLLGFDLKKVEQPTYYITGTSDVSKAKGIKSLILVEPDKLTIESTSIVGLAIFSKISDLENPVLVLEIVIITILLIVYVIYRFDLLDIVKDRFLKKENPDLKEISNLMKDLSTCLESNETENANIVYADIMNAYKKLSAESKAEVHEAVMGLYGKLLLSQALDLINLTMAHIKYNDLNQARENYKKIMTIYKQLDKEQKSSINERCGIIFKKLSDAAAKSEKK